MPNNVVALQEKQSFAIQTKFEPQNLHELIEWSDRAAKSTLVPKDYLGKSANIIIAVQMGAELGLAPMQALQNIAVINGKPSLYGDAMLAVCRASPLCEYIEEEIKGETKEKWEAICRVKRRGDKKEIVSRFSWQDAIFAGLTNKDSPWRTYPKRMLQMRARGFALRDAFPDLLRGLITVEEASDYPSPTPSNTPPSIQPKPAPSIQASPIPEPRIITLEERIETTIASIKSKKTKADLDDLSQKWTDKVTKARAENNAIPDEQVSRVAEAFNEAYCRLANTDDVEFMP
ncbi:hypothetical protein COMNV_00605 [Commensalibacter sp. Nvir]|uniref:hypothetical protein n=1 Tax=Commensalibacter sp. Nvir TaxID=3069817 RepID=UPI002D636ABA|nr:hypothetical protein COMNV_00605 [Commensalibacter sp. Nvir]